VPPALPEGAPQVGAYIIYMCFGIGGLFVDQEIVTVGTVAAFVLYLNNLFEPVQQLGQIYNTVQSAGAALGKLFIGQLRFAEAETELREAVKLNPNYSTARQWLGTLYSRLRRCEEARTHVEIGARLDPLTALVNEAVGSVYLMCGEPERAISILENVLHMHPTAVTTRTMLGRALTGAGRPAEAVKMLEPIITPDGESFGPAALMNAYFHAG